MSITDPTQPDPREYIYALPTPRKPPNEKLLAWMWSVGVVAAFVALACTLAGILWAAATLAGPIPALVAGLVLFCIVVGTAVWLGNGKRRP